ncbi:uncharacterized protein LOC143787924 [Ranitomeya variabilis]|uniref:uncharacterized protein LOC143787924 n=1 Tax=Ranitomeya variabilis TaxID=490064 RepID=UPI004055D133
MYNSKFKVKANPTTPIKSQYSLEQDKPQGRRDQERNRANSISSPRCRSRSLRRDMPRLLDYGPNTKSFDSKSSPTKMDSSTSLKRMNPGAISERYISCGNNSEVGDDVESSDTSPNQTPLKSKIKYDNSESHKGANSASLHAPIHSAGSSKSDQDDLISKLMNKMDEKLESLVKTMKIEMDSNFQRYCDKIDKIDKQLSKHEERLNRLEHRSSISFDELDRLNLEMKHLRSKMVDLEDRGRQNNLKIRGISEDVTQEQMSTHLKNIFKSALPDLSDLDLTIDRAHRLPKPPKVSTELPRDTILKLHFFKTKEMILAYLKDKKTFPEP